MLGTSSSCHNKGLILNTHSNHPRFSICVLSEALPIPPHNSKKLNIETMDLSMKMVKDIPSLISHHWKNKAFNWPMIIYVTLVHSLAAAGVMRLSKCSAETLIFAFILWPIR
jgi:hypothetical protein